MFDLLEPVRRVLATPAMWCQGSYGQDAGGNGVNTSEAVSFCLSGALKRVRDSGAWTPTELGEVTRELEKRCMSAMRSRAFMPLPGSSIMPVFNDNSTFEQIRVLLSKPLPKEKS